jgi:acyl-CoA thioesterase
LESESPAAPAIAGNLCPFTARAWWATTLVAESDRALHVEEPGQPPRLYFPEADVRIDEFHLDDAITSSPDRGPQRTWSVAPVPGAQPPARVAWHGAGLDTSDGQAVLRAWTDPPAELSWLRGLATFDEGRVLVEVVDDMGDPDPRGTTRMRFPPWGDASHLIDLLAVQPDGPGRYVSGARSSLSRPVVEGSQMLGQAIVAAGHLHPGRRLVSAHMVFIRVADAAQPLDFELDTLSAGRTFTTLSVDVRQGGRRCARASLLLNATAPDLIRHQVPGPDVPEPYACASYDMGVTGRDVRVVDDAYTDDPDAPVGPPVLDAWVRFRQVPADPSLHAGLLAQFTGHMSIAAALRPHEGVGQRQAHRTISTAINAIGLSLHADIRADEWMLYHHGATFAGDGMTHAECRVHNEAGHLLASFTVDAMVRGFDDPTATVDDRSAL